MLENNTQHAEILNELLRRINSRKKIKAFHPDKMQGVVDAGKDFFTLFRGDENRIWIIANFTPDRKRFDTTILKDDLSGCVDLLSGKEYLTGLLDLDPYQVVWLEQKKS